MAKMVKTGSEFVMRSLAASALLSIGLSGCASYHPKPLSAPANAARFSKRSLDSAVLHAFIQTQRGHPVTAWPPKAWTLDDLTLAALHYHPELALARAHWANARAKAITAGAYPNPTLQFLPQYATNADAAISPWTIGLSVNIPILTADKRSYRIAEALDKAEAARLDVVQTAWQIRSHVRKSWLKFYAAQRRVTLLNNQVQDASALLDAFRQQLDAGQISQRQVIQARLRLRNAQLNRADAKAIERHARATLAGAVAVPVTALRGIHFDYAAVRKLPAPKKMPTARFKTYALTQRPDIRAALVRYAASAQALKLEIAHQYPNIQIGPGYKWDQGVHRWSIGFSLGLPIFNQNQGPIAQARAQREKQAAQFRVLQEHITTQFNSAMAAYQASSHQLKLAQYLLKASQIRLASARASYQAGETNRVNLLRIQLETQGYRLAVLKTQVQAERALATLEDALEHPLYQPTAASRAIEKIAPPVHTPSHDPSTEAFSS